VYVDDNPTNLADPLGLCPECQQQKAPGFWRQFGQRIKNWFNDDGFKTNEQLDSEAGYSTATILNYSEVDLSGSGFATANDTAGVEGVLLSNMPLGFASSAASAIYDPSFVNLDLDSLSNAIPYVIEGSDLPIAAGFAVYDGSQFAGNTMITVFTPNTLQSNTINANGITLQDPQAAAFDSGSW
jgi:hypothetical protein